MKTQRAFRIVLLALCIIFVVSGINPKRQIGIVSAKGDTGGVQRIVENPLSTNDLSYIEIQSTAQQIAAGYYFTCDLSSAGGVRCWGYNQGGQLGDGSYVDRYTPVDVSGLTGGIIAIAAGGWHACALTSAGGVKCWGLNIYGPPEDGYDHAQNVPEDIEGLTSGVSAIAAGQSHTCILTTSGGVKCWGDNEYGQLGNGTTTTSPIPLNVSGLTEGVIAISAGWYHTCAIMNTGAVKCWGSNEYGQLGDGTTVDKNTPVDVYELTSGISATTAGEDYTCALTNSGGVKCWGHNQYGRLGNGTFVDSLIPVDIGNLSSGVTAISARRAHTCALTSSAGIMCWGDNLTGQLGDGTDIDKNLPVDVSGLTTGVITVGAGDWHTCAITTSGEIKCWGENSYGQLGDGTTINHYTPEDVTQYSEALLSNISHSNIQAGSTGFALTLTGTNFVDGAEVFWNGSARSTTFISSTQLNAAISAEDVSAVQAVQVTVKNPSSTESNALQVNVYTFADVLPSAWYWRWVEGFYAQGITTGCAANPLGYCPERAVTRAEMAVFILRAKNGTATPTPTSTGMFADVPVMYKEWMQPWIEQFYNEGITTGCAAGPLQYCPERQVTRAEMAVFVLRAVHGPDYVPPAATGVFSDVPVTGKEWMQPWIEQFYNEGITTGCASSPLRYCPEQSVTRAEMAVFIDRAFGYVQVP